MTYYDLVNKLSLLGLKADEINISSPLALKKIIESGSKELYSFFEREAFNDENTEMIINTSSNENEIQFLDRKLYLNKKELIKILINKNYFSTIQSFIDIDTILSDDEIFNCFLDKLENYNANVGLIDRIVQRSNKKEIIISKLIETKRFDLIAFLMVSYYNSELFIKKEIKSLLQNDFEKIIKIMQLLNIKISLYDIKKDMEYFDLLFLNGYYEALKVLSTDCPYSSHIYSDQIILDKIIYYIEKEKTKFLDILKNMYSSKELLSNTRVLKSILKIKEYDYLDMIEPSAWNFETSIDLLKTIDIKVLEKIKRVNEIPLLNYYYNYTYNYYSYGQDYNDLNDINNISQLRICIKINEDIKNGSINVDSNLIRLYRFLAECNSINICRLAYAIVDNDINNVDKLINENGLTELFKNFLKYDVDYINIFKNSIIDDNVNYQTYIDILSLDQNMKVYLKNLLVNQFNINDYFSNNTLTRKAIENLYSKDGIMALEILLNNNYKLELNDLEKAIIFKYNSIKSPSQKETFFNYCNKNKEISIDEVDKIYDLIIKINNSNSYELRKRSDDIIKKLSKLDNYEKVFDEIEYIFTSGSVPEFMKRFAMYKILIDNKITEDRSVTSPILKSLSEEEAEKVILSDLFRVSLSTNSRDIINYLNILENGQKVYNSLSKESNIKNENLQEEVKSLLHEYRIRLEYVCDYLLNLKYTKSKDDYKTLKNIEEAYYAKKGWNFGNVHFPNMLDFMLGDISDEFKGMIILRTYIAKHEILKTAYEEGRNLRKEKPTLKSGDFIKGIDSKFLDNIVSFGSLSIEFLGEDSAQDVTHLDTDMSLMSKDYNSIPELLKDTNLTGSHWEDMKLIISRDLMNMFDECIITKDKNGVKEFSEKDKNKYEIFNFNNSDEHYCIRTAFPLSFVKAIIASQNFSRARFIVSKNNFYIPIYDTQNNLVYSFEEWVNDRKKLEGLSYYDNEKYNISNNLLTPEIKEVLNQLNNEEDNVNKQREAIYNKLNEVVSKYFSETKHQVSSSVNKGVIEIIDTGSTGRNTNLPNDFDFDFIVRVDKDFIKSDKLNQFSSEIYKMFNVPKGDSKVIRIDNASIEGIDHPLKIELTLLSKNSKISYTTDMCIQDRLSNIESQYPDKLNLVKANIIYAKNFFKNLTSYKPYEGGFGGVGVENFILQHGGSFMDAIEHFVDVADSSKDLTEFKQKFHIYDYGKNHYSYEEDNYKKVYFPYDDYVSRMTDNSYKTILNAFKEYIRINKESKKIVM